MLVAHFAYLLKDDTQLSNLDRDMLLVHQKDSGINDTVVYLEVGFTFISPRLGLKRMWVFAITTGQPPAGAGETVTLHADMSTKFLQAVKLAIFSLSIGTHTSLLKEAYLRYVIPQVYFVKVNDHRVGQLEL